MLTFGTAVQSPLQGLYSPEIKQSLQTTATPVGLALKPPFYRDLSSPGYVTVAQPKSRSFDNSNTAALVTASVTWSSCRGPGG